MNGLLQIQNMSSGYNGKIVLENISFSVHRGEVLAIIGQNGCGKSTLLKTIARVISVNTGNISFAGKSLNGKNTWDLKSLGISWVVQGGMIFPTMKVSEHLALALHGKTLAEATRIKDECFYYFPLLASILTKRGGNLSGGQRQMLSCAMLLCQQTQCWFLDEITAGLSPEAVKEVVTFLNKMKQDQKKTMVLVEHNYQVAFELADLVTIIKEGRLQGIFTKTEFLNEDFLKENLYN